MSVALLRTLVAFFSLDVGELPPEHDGEPRFELTKKFVDGMALTSKLWGERVVAVMAPRTTGDTNLDQRKWTRAELPFELVVREPEADVDDVIKGAHLVMLGVDYRHVAIAKACRRLHVPYVVVGEYDLRTRLQIATAEVDRLDKRARRMVWEIGQEAKQRRVISEAAGLQCNGTPTFDSWARLSRAPLLYFDTRVTSSMLASQSDAAKRGTSPVLRLAFSGRFVAMKGVMHLPNIADRLRRRGVKFVLDVYGGGPLEDKLRERIAEYGLGEMVKLRGTVPFDELMRRVTADVDVFVCPHVQGDPSCTYLETMSCAVPIAGFANDAWRGLHQRSRAGWTAALADDDALAGVIAKLDGNRSEIAAAARRALDFAREHTFDGEFARRIEHLKSVAKPA